LKEGAGGSRWKGEDGVVIIYIYFEGRGQRELIGVKAGNDTMCYYLKEGADGSRWVRRRGMRWVVFHKIKIYLVIMNGIVCLSLI